MPIAELGQDVRFVWRQIRRAPGFAISAVLTLAIGIGANTGLFSLLNGYWRPLPVPGGERVVLIAKELPGDDGGMWFRFSYPEVNDYREQGREVFADVFAFDTHLGGITIDGKTTQFLYQPVTGNVFAGLQLTPAAGRLFAPGEGEHHGGEPLVVLSHGFWQQRFGGDHGVVGTGVKVNGLAARVIGVTPEGFHGLYQGADAEGFVTLNALRAGRRAQAGALFTDRSMRWFTMLARLHPGATIEQAQGVVDVVSRRLEAEHPEMTRNVGARVMWETAARPIPLRILTSLTPLIRTSGLALAGLVLLIACMNVANLLFVRATARAREMAVRSALGSGRARLVRLLLVESVLLAVAGTVLGLVFARWSTDLFLASVTPAFELPINLDFHYDWRVFSYAAGVASLTGVLVGLVPALRASRPRVTGVLHDGGHGSSAGAGRLRVRNFLVVAQVGGSLVLLVAAGLFVRSLQRAQQVELGFDPGNILTVRLDPRQVGYPRERMVQFYDELERRLTQVPGIETVSMAFTIPAGYVFDSTDVIRDGETVSTDQPAKLVGCNSVTSRYFEAMRLPIVSGRAFSEQDTATTSRVVIVNETMASEFWPGQSALGKRLRIPRFPDEEPWEVVGVARDSKYLAVFESPTPYLYFPMAQHATSWRTLHLRTTVSPESVAPRVAREIQALDPEMPVADIRSMEQALEGGVGFLMFRIGAIQAGAMGVLGLLLAIVGVYGVVSYGATQRTREMGIRVALGAEPNAIRALVMRQGLVLVSAGVVVGLVAAFGMTRLTARFFVLVGSNDAVTFVAVTVLLLSIALAACYLPARRAMRVDPMIALRHE